MSTGRSSRDGRSCTATCCELHPLTKLNDESQAQSHAEADAAATSPSSSR